MRKIVSTFERKEHAVTLRRFSLLGALACIILFAGYGCSSSPSGPSTPSTSRTFTSSLVSGHTHRITLAKAEVETPPVTGISRETSSSGGHTHTFTMSEAQLTSVKGGGTETVTTSVAGSHSHTFTITKWY